MKKEKLKSQELIEILGKVTKFMDEIKDDIYLEGAFYNGCDSPKTLMLSIIYNDNRFKGQSILNQRKIEYKGNGIDFKIDLIPYWYYFNEEITSKRKEYPLEFLLRYGEILYDKNGNLLKLKQELEKDSELETYLNYWKDVCELEPPIQYIKR